MNYPRISIITPNFNQAEFLEQTIVSVLNQNYPNLEYIIIDGGSTDGSVDIIRKYENRLSYWISEPDNGMYYALQKGFIISTGEIMGWINSDDILHKNSLFIIASLFENNPLVNWIQGYPNVINENGTIIFEREPRYKVGPFLLKHYNDWIFVQQESTFWRRKLWEKAGSEISVNYKFAGDFELWMRFFNFDNLYITKAYIGAFRSRVGQISGVSGDLYLKECDQIIDLQISLKKWYIRIYIKMLTVIEPTIRRFKFLYNYIVYYKECDTKLILKK